MNPPKPQPEPQVVTDINQRIRAVLDEAPSDSSAEFAIHQSVRGFKGFLKIYSAKRRFVGSGFGGQATEVVDQIFNEIRRQIQDWKRERYAMPFGDE